MQEVPGSNGTEPRKGLVQVYTGDGKGKTTAALGQALRAVGHHQKVCVIQFLKGDVRYGELRAADLLSGLTIIQCGKEGHVDPQSPDPVDAELAQGGIRQAAAIARSGAYDLVILDEINVAMKFGLVTVQQVLDLIECKSERTELVLTGRWAPPDIIERADLVSEIQELKHPYRNGVLARKGVEY